ncbi:hypothetical protein [Sulfurimonas sp. C5]|uniref:hypothetical protein n=1 Tax=Sulfurimonas sp. C5 TaxID=3036947 RepID=UPI002457F91C|nr:hypothetical protein [Sulfurimonas sp. C5]MDH4945203.1 hypothetical protein [Sulfurimonas sp. C5]
MLSKILESLYLKVFINIVVERSSTTVHIEIHSKTNDISHFENVFPSTKLTEEIYEFVMEYTKESPYYYVSFLDTSKEQGALPSCDKNKLSFYKDLSTAEYKCINNEWSIYTSKTELYELERKYEDIGIDFVFSPFSVIAKFFKDKISKQLAMFALIEDSSISVAVFENSQLLYAEYLDMEIDIETDKIVLEDLDEDKDFDLDLDDEGIVLDDMDVNDELEDFSDIEDLDSLEDIDEFSEGKDLEEELYENEAQEKITALEESRDEENHFTEDYQRFSLIQNAFNHFYKDPKYEGKFIENIYIADNMKVSSDLRRYLEEEMFLNVYIRTVDLGAEICELAKEELGL